MRKWIIADLKAQNELKFEIIDKKKINHLYVNYRYYKKMHINILGTYTAHLGNIVRNIF